MDAGDEGFLVVGAVEDADFAAGGEVDDAAPEEIVREFGAGGGGEGGDVAGLLVEAGEDVLDDAVLAGGVRGLKDDEEGPGAFGVEAVVEQAELGAEVFEGFDGVVLVAKAEGVAGVMVGEGIAGAEGDPEFGGVEGHGGIAEC